MIIRNLRQYFEKYFGQELNQEIDQQNDRLYSKLVNGNLEARVSDLVNFAVNPSMQVFYEMIQNAHDAKSKRVEFHFSKDFFIVINDGQPLKTDFENNNKSLPNGQLISFLGKNLGEKFGKAELIGRHGIGSKLLYYLLTPRSNSTDFGIESRTHAKLIETIINKLNGPVVFSWEGLSQLEEFFLTPFDSIKQSNEFSPKHPLLFKVLYSYYPATPGEIRNTKSGANLELFNKVEYDRLRAALEVIKPAFRSILFEKGTLIFVPLGDGQYDQIIENYERYVVNGIKGSLTFLNSIKSVTINAKQLNATPYHKKEFEIKVDTTTTEKLVLAFPTYESDLNASIPNFYTYFPIASTNYGLNFTINTRIYETDQSRQNLDLSNEVNKTNLGVISKEIINSYIKRIKSDEINEYIDFIRCIINTNLEQIKIERLIHQLFFLDIIEAISGNIPTSSGQFFNHNMVFGKKTELEIPIELFGINDAYWLHPDLTKYSHLVTELLKVQILSNTQIIERISTHPKTTTWICNLPEKTYEQLIVELVNENNGKQFDKLSIIKFSDQTLRPLNHLNANGDFIFMFGAFKPLLPILSKIGFTYSLIFIDSIMEIDKVYGITYKDAIILQLKKLISGINNSNTLDITDKWTIINVFSQFDSPAAELISQLRIFENKQGEKKPLNRLYYDAIQDAQSGVLNQYELKAKENYYQKLNKWLLNKNNVWEVLLLEWDECIKNRFNVQDFELTIKDLNFFFSSNLHNSTIKRDQAWIPCADGNWASADQVFYANDTTNSIFGNNIDYELLGEFIERATKLICLPSSFLVILEQVKWVDWPKIDLAYIGTKFEENNWYPISKDQLRLLLQIPNGENSFFSFFVITYQNDRYYISKNTSKIQFFLENDIELTNFLNSKETYFSLPKSLYEYFAGRDKVLRIKNEAFAYELLGKFGSIPELIDIVGVSQNTVYSYLNNFTKVNLFSDSGPSDYKNTFEGKLIRLIATSEKVEKYRHLVYIDHKPISNYTYDPTISLEKIEFNLSELWPEQSLYVTALDKVREKCFGLTKQFDRLLLSKKLTDFTEIIKEINSNGVDNTTQFCFITVYKSQNKDFSTKISYSPHLGIKDVLEQLYQKDIIFYKDYLEDRFCELDVSHKFISGDPFLTLKKERLPSWIIEWYQEDITGKKKSFLISSGLIDGKSGLLEFRSNFPNASISDLANQDRTWFLENTLEWIYKQKNEPVREKSTAFVLVNSIVEYLSRQPNYTPSYLWTITSIEEEGIYFKLEPTKAESQEKVFSTKISDQTFSIWKTITENTDLTIFYVEEKILDTNLKSSLASIGVEECTFNEKFVEEDNPSEEWCNPIYQIWKEKNGNSLSILIVKEQISFELIIEIGKNQVPRKIGTRRDRLVERTITNDGKTNLYLFSTTEEDRDIVNILFENRDLLLKSIEEKNLLIELQSRVNYNNVGTSAESTLTQEALNQFSAHQIEQLANYSDIIDSLISFAPTIRKIDQETLDRLSININTISNLLRAADSELLDSLLINLDWIKEELEKDRKIPTPEALIGYIGERLVLIWLEQQGKTCNYVANYTPEYDIEFEFNHRLYKVDVKTTNSSIKNSSESIPFFVKKSQYNYIQANPEIDYYIVRLSLPDIKLDYLYQEYKGKGNDFSSIVESYHEEIDNSIRIYLESPENRILYKQNRTIFRLNLGSDEIMIFENPETNNSPLD